jgi:ankyrin repeat protein
MFCHQKIIIFCIVWFFINFSSYTDSENVNIQFDVRRIIREYNGNVTSALHRALCPEPDFELIKALIREGADVNHLNKKWEITPLGTAARCDVHGTGQDLDKTNLSIEDKKAEASRRTIESLRILIEAGADVNISNGIALRNVASSSLNSEVIDFLVENGADINVKNGVGATALFEARNPDLIRALIRFGIDFNVRNKYHDCTALMNILWMGANLETLEAHLETGIDVNAKSKDGLTALIAAIRYNEPSVIRRLIEAGANVNDISTSGYTILMSVLFNAQTVTLEVVQMLLDAGAQADINLQSQYNGQTALMISLSNVHNQDTAIISALMKAGAELNNLTDKKGRTALLIAAENTGNPDILSLLINAGAD